MTYGSRLFVTDCEGPLSRNDNAQEIAARFIPDGAEFFARLSRYDDFLADVEKRPGYNAGDTLRLLPPFLLAYEATDAEIEDFSTENVLLVPGVLRLVDALAPLLPTYIISTSYTPYLRALCAVTRFPIERVRCTGLELHAWRMPDDEKEWLREQVMAILARPVIDIPDGATSMGNLSPEDERTVGELNQLFWHEMTGRVSGAMLEAVHPVGGGAKLTALLGVVAENETTLPNVMYVGDSITDAPAFAAVRDAGGVSLSFNGNAYALAAAEFAAASADTAPTIDLAKSFARGGRAAVIDAVRRWPKPRPGDKLKPRDKAAAVVGIVSEAGDGAAPRPRLRGGRRPTAAPSPSAGGTRASTRPAREDFIRRGTLASVARSAKAIGHDNRRHNRQRHLATARAPLRVGLVPCLAHPRRGVGAVSLGPLLLLPAAVVFALIVSRRGLGRSAFGLLTGAAAVSLYVAYVQRKGPGTVYWHTATAGGADTYLDPRPWLVAGILLAAGGLLGFLLAHSTFGDRPEVERHQ